MLLQEMRQTDLILPISIQNSGLSWKKRISQLDELGIQADVILLHPYDKWGFSKMDKETDILYLKYAVDCLSHYKNVWWSLANEFDLLPWKSVEDWETYARVVMRRDPYGHLRSIHNCGNYTIIE